jgi:hypothetical protein
MQPSASDESLRSLLLRQSNDLRALQEFSELERECFDKQLAEMKVGIVKAIVVQI